MKRTLWTLLLLCGALTLLMTGCVSADMSVGGIETELIFGVFGVVGFLGLAVKDFCKSDWGIKKEWLKSENRGKLQIKSAFYELGIALFGALSVCSLYGLLNQALGIVSAIATLVIFVLWMLNSGKK